MKRTITRTLAASAMSLPLAFGVSGVALADSGINAELQGSIEVQNERNNSDESRDDGFGEELLGEELFGGLFEDGNEFGQNNEDRSNNEEDDGLLAGIL